GKEAACGVARLVGALRRRRLQGAEDRAGWTLRMAGPQLTPGAQRAATWRRYLRFWGPRAEADVDDELRFHIEMRVRDYIARGMSEDEARDATARRLGDLATNRAECLTITTRRERRMTRAQLIDALGQDAHFAFRTLGRQK